MNEHRIVEEREIVIADLLWGLLIQWRGLLACGLIFAVLLTGLKYAVDLHAYTKKANTLSTSESRAAASAEQDEEEAEIDEALFLTMNDGDGKNLAGAQSGMQKDQEKTGKAGTEKEEPLAGSKAPLSILQGGDGTYYLEKMPTENPVVRALNYFSFYKDQEDYYNNSILMRVNTENEHRLYMLYYVKAQENGETDPFITGNMYARLVYDNGFINSVADALGLKTEPRYLKEIFKIFTMEDGYVSTGQAGMGFGVQVILSGAEDFDEIERSLTKKIEAAHDDIEKTAGPHTLKKLTCSVSTINDLETRQQQTDAYTRMINASNAFEKAYDTLSVDEKHSVDKVIIEGNVKKILGDYRAGRAVGDPLIDNTDPVGKKPSLSRTSVIAGFLLGALFYAFLYLLGILFFRRIRGEKDIGRATGLRSFGGVYTYPWTGGPGRFLHDRMLYNRRRKKHGRPEEAADRIARSIAARADHEGIKYISLITLGDTSRWADNILNRQKKLLSGECGIDAGRIYCPGKSLAIDEEVIRQLSPVCIVLLSGTTLPSMAADLLTRLQEYGIPVLGTEFLEGA